MTPMVRQILDNAKGWAGNKRGATRKLKDGRTIAILEDTVGVIAGLQGSSKAFVRFPKTEAGVKDALAFTETLQMMYGGWAE